MLPKNNYLFIYKLKILNLNNNNNYAINVNKMNAIPKKKAASLGAAYTGYTITLFLFVKMSFVTVHELINPTSGIHKLHFASIEWV